MLSALRESAARFFNYVARGMHAIGFTAMSATVAGLLAAIGSSYLYYEAQYSRLLLPWAAGLLLLSGFFDAVDGSLARSFGKVSRFGGFVDSLIDRVDELLVLSSIILAGLCDTRWGLWAIGSSLLVSYARSRGETEGADMKVGIAERPERLLILVFATLFGQIEGGVIVIAVLSTITVIQRIFRARSQLVQA
ncbi:MAG: CDP-alcohol phosphatidyltransferase family protein [archaeon]